MLAHTQSLKKIFFIITFLILFVLGNTRVISQTALDHFRTSLTTRVHDPYSVLLRRNKLPMALLDEAANPHAQKVRGPNMYVCYGSY